MLTTPFEAAFIGHLVGDYLLQNDQIAANKTKSTWWCLWHVFLYTAAVVGLLITEDVRWAHWGWLLAIAVPHFLMDRFRLAWWLMQVNGQKLFSSNAMAPWSIVVVDNTIHLVCLYLTVRAFAWLNPEVL